MPWNPAALRAQILASGRPPAEQALLLGFVATVEQTRRSNAADSGPDRLRLPGPLDRINAAVDRLLAQPYTADGRWWLRFAAEDGSAAQVYVFTLLQQFFAQNPDVPPVLTLHATVDHAASGPGVVQRTVTLVNGLTHQPLGACTVQLHVGMTDDVRITVTPDGTALAQATDAYTQHLAVRAAQHRAGYAALVVLALEPARLVPALRRIGVAQPTALIADAAHVRAQRWDAATARWHRRADRTLLRVRRRAEVTAGAVQIILWEGLSVAYAAAQAQTLVAQLEQAEIATLLADVPAQPVPAAPPPTAPLVAPPPDSGHYSHTHDKRRAIVAHYRADKAKGLISDKEAWAQTHYHITGRTLRNYEEAFPAETFPAES